MGDVFLEFECSRAAHYTWLTAKMNDGRSAVPVLARSGEAGAEAYRPMDRSHATLYRTFAETSLTMDGVMAFGTAYGMLGRPVSVDIDGGRFVEPFSDEDDRPWPRVHTWCGQIEIMRLAVALRDSLANQDGPATFQKLLRAPWGRYFGQSPFTRKSKDATAEARRVLTVVVNRMLGETVSVRMSESRGELRLTYGPLGLLGALWLQLAMATTEHKSYPQCKYCRQLFEIAKGPTGFRRNRQFCSDRCKSADYRKRRRLTCAAAE